MDERDVRIGFGTSILVTENGNTQERHKREGVGSHHLQLTTPGSSLFLCTGALGRRQRRNKNFHVFSVRLQVP